MAAKKNDGRNIVMPARIIFAALVILIQIVLLVVIMYIASSRAMWIYAVLWAASVVAVAIVVNRRGNPSFKIAWVIFIMLAPFCGGLVFLLWGGGKTTPKMKKRWRNISAKTSKLIKQDESVSEKLKYNDLYHSIQSEYLYRESHYPVYDNTYTTYYPSGEEFFASLIAEIEQAEHYVFIEFFILAEGKLWNRLYKILRRKIEQGVEVRIIFDDFGSLRRQRSDFVEHLESNGFNVSVFNPIRPSVDLFLNNRNHRKIVVIDGKTSFTGGLNIGDEYINDINVYGHWCDSGVRLTGRATKSFIAMFCTMWNTINADDPIEPLHYFVNCSVPCVGFVQPYCDGPLEKNNPAEGLYMKIINSAQKYIYITSPYLILDSTMIKQLTLAAKSGVDVRIVTPKKWDKWYVHPVTQYYYEELLESGVRIYEYTPGFIHAKLFVSDDSVATVGTINMDYRSFYFHFECGCWMCGNQSVADIKSHINEIMAISDEIKLERWKRRPALGKFKQALLHLFAPFM